MSHLLAFFTPKRIGLLLIPAIIGLFLLFNLKGANAIVVNNSLIKTAGSSTVYYVWNSKRYAFPSEKMFFSWYQNFHTVVVVSATELASYPLAGNVTYKPGTRLVKLVSAPTVYTVNKCGVLHALGSSAVAAALFGSQWTSLVDDLSDAFFPHYVVGSPIQSAAEYTTSNLTTIGENVCTQSERDALAHNTPPTTNTNTNIPATNTNTNQPVVQTNTNTNTNTPPSNILGIAAQYPGDTNIDKDPNVIFTEMGEEATTQELFGHWSNNSGTATIALDPSTSPAKSTGHQSIKLSTTANTNPIAILYKSFPQGYSDTVYARWYVKYNTDRTFHHSGIRLGGNNPPSTKNPTSPAGVKPNGSDFFYLGAEPTQEKVTASTFDFFNYWPEMRTTSFFPGKYYGNSFINNPNVTIALDQWNCIEVRLKLNSPTASDGEISMWINGVLVSDIKGGVTGTWDEDNFVPGTGSAFEGFQWRTDPNLLINYFSLSHYVDQDTLGQVNSIHFDHVVLAKSYIGPIQ